MRADRGLPSPRSRQSLVAVAMGATFLAAKVEEQGRRIEDVLNVFYLIFHRRHGFVPRPLIRNGMVCCIVAVLSRCPSSQWRCCSGTHDGARY